MDFDFIPDSNALRIPQSVYHKIKRCHNCSSVYLNETYCDTCGATIGFSQIGQPFGFKSFLETRNRYFNQLGFLVKMFPIFEDKNSSKAKSYTRNLQRRFKDLLSGLNSAETISVMDRKLFYLELRELSLELMNYGVDYSYLRTLVIESQNGELFYQELISFINEKSLMVTPMLHWSEVILKYRLWGILKVQFLLMTTIILATVLFVAINFRALFFY